jgi:glycosyltransferase involved in cell wall biosynthesis/SAM-dependent methyltransferase
MRTCKKIAILTSLYNCEDFLPGYFEALTKIEGKEMIEVLLLHNAPTTKEIEIIQSYLPKLDFVRHIIIPEREGLYATWNRGVLLSEGEYITVWNVDDVRFPDSVLQQAEALDTNPQAAIAYGDIWISNTYGVFGSKITNVPLYNKRKFFFQSYGMSCFQMWRKCIHQTIGYYDEQFKCVADFDFQIRAALHFPFVKTKEPLGIYLEDQPHKLSANGQQQELENNIVYLRYGVYEKVNPFSVGLSRKKYRKKELLFFGKWYPYPNGKSTNLIRVYGGLAYSLIKNIVKQSKIIIMKPFLKRIYKTSAAYGFDPKKLRNRLRDKKNKVFLSDMEEFLRQKGTDTSFQWGQVYPVLTEKQEEGGTMRGAYFHQDLYVAQQIYAANPQKHVDIGSRVDGFVAHVASFRKIEMMDIRPIQSSVSNIIFRQADLMNLPEGMIDYCDSISSLHAIEHFGLGRYSDPIDYYGHLKGIENITKMLKRGGVFYFSVPIGQQRVEFNEQRVFSVEYLIRILSADYTIQSFSYVTDKGDLVENAELTEKSIQTNFSCWYGCGIFTLKKNSV